MPTRFDLPALGTKDYEQLRRELTESIPRYTTLWTDFNYSDPGITLLQLLCWFGDITLYRVDSVPLEFTLNMVRWLVGATGEDLDDLVDQLENEVVTGPNGAYFALLGTQIVLDPGRLELALAVQRIEAGGKTSAAELHSLALAYWTRPYRAVTADDFERLTLEVTRDLPSSSSDAVIRRAVVQTEPPFVTVVPIIAYAQTYTVPSPVRPTTAGPLIETLTVTLQTGDNGWVAYLYQQVLTAVRGYLEPRRLLGAPVRVEAPVIVPVILSIQLACQGDANPDSVLAAAWQAVFDLLSPFTGGSDGKGWPYGRAPTEWDIVLAVGKVNGVDHSQPIHVQLDEIRGLQVGSAQVGVTTYLGWGEREGLPQVWSATIEALTDTWTLQVGVHARVGIDTRLPLPGV